MTPNAARFSPPYSEYLRLRGSTVCLFLDLVFSHSTTAAGHLATEARFNDPTMLRVLLLCWAAMLGILVLLLRQRYRLEKLRYEVEEMKMRSARMGEPV